MFLRIAFIIRNYFRQPFNKAFLVIVACQLSFLAYTKYEIAKLDVELEKIATKRQRMRQVHQNIHKSQEADYETVEGESFDDTFAEKIFRNEKPVLNFPSSLERAKAQSEDQPWCYETLNPSKLETRIIFDANQTSWLNMRFVLGMNIFES